MKRTLLLTISLLCAGCGASRQAARSAETLVRDTAAAGTSEMTADRTVQEQTATGQEFDEEVITVTTLYDTSQPADPATGTPPVKARTAQTRRTAVRTRQETAAAGAETRTQRTSQATAERSELNAAAETTVRRGMNGMQRLLCTGGLLAAAAAAVWLLLRRRLR